MQYHFLRRLLDKAYDIDNDIEISYLDIRITSVLTMPSY